MKWSCLTAKTASIGWLFQRRGLSFILHVENHYWFLVRSLFKELSAFVRSDGDETSACKVVSSVYKIVLFSRSLHISVLDEEERTQNTALRNIWDHRFNLAEVSINQNPLLRINQEKFLQQQTTLLTRKNVNQFKGKSQIFWTI